MPTVYGVSLSPYVRKVQIFLEQKAIAYEHDPVIPMDVSAEFKRKSPLGKVPCYEDENLVVPDSSVICQYIEDTHPATPMFPADPVSKARARWFEEYGDTKLLEVLGPPLFFELVVKPNFLNESTDQARVEDNLTNGIPPVFDYLEEHAPASGFMFGENLGIADIAVGSPFLNARYADFEVDAARWPTLAAYVTRILDHEAFKKRAQADMEMMSNPPT